VRSDRMLIAAVLILFVFVFAGFLITSNPRQTVPEKKPLNPPPTDPELQDTATVIERKAENIEGVVEASVLVLSRIALIALNLDDELTEKRVDEVKREVADTAEGLPNVDEVLVTANPDIVAEVKDILAGEAPLDSLEDIYRRILEET